MIKITRIKYYLSPKIRKDFQSYFFFSKTNLIHFISTYFKLFGPLWIWSV